MLFSGQFYYGAANAGADQAMSKACFAQFGPSTVCYGPLRTCAKRGGGAVAAACIPDPHCSASIPEAYTISYRLGPIVLKRADNVHMSLLAVDQTEFAVHNPDMDDEEKTTLSLRYVGRRFNGARLPLDVLSDLPALRDLVAALAKHEFRQNNPDRKRVPQGFDRAISFSLIDVEEGSAVPVIALDYEVAQQSLPKIGDGMSEVVENAFHQIAKIYDDADHDRFPQALPLDAIRALSKLGAGIQDDEHIEFVGACSATGDIVSLDAYRRKKLLTRVRETYTTEFEGIGQLTGIDAATNTVQVETEQYGQLRLQLEGTAMPAEQFDGNLFALVEFSISLELDANDELKSVETVHSVDLISPYGEAVSACVRRLQELSTVERGWLGEDQGEQLVHLAGMRATQLVFMRADLAELFKIYPTEDGGISVEFDKDGWSFAVEILPDGTLEIDGSSEDGGIFEAQGFDGFSDEFFKAFDQMTSVVCNDED